MRDFLITSKIFISFLFIIETKLHLQTLLIMDKSLPRKPLCQASVRRIRIVANDCPA